MQASAQHHRSRLPPTQLDELPSTLRSTKTYHEISQKSETAVGVYSLPLIAALGKQCANTISAPYSTPVHDTSAMDGFAVESNLTVSASKASPVRLRISHVLAAGDKLNKSVESEGSCKVADRVPEMDGQCVEIMTGAQLPEITHPQLDAVVKIEDVEEIQCKGGSASGARYIEVYKPVGLCQNRRCAGSDLHIGAPIINAGETVEPKHIMALASVGYGDVEIVRRDCETKPHIRDHQTASSGLKIGVISTGSELADVFELVQNPKVTDLCETGQIIPNSNAPYLISRLKQVNPFLDVQYLGIAQDTEAALGDKFSLAFDHLQCDVVITTGGVSMGRFDLVRPVLEYMGARVVFHGVNVRPGLPVLFAVLEPPASSPRDKPARMTAVFGLPGNPIATAMALRFFVIPYLAMMRKPSTAFSGPSPVLHVERPISFQSAQMPCRIRSPVTRRREKPTHLNVFWLARRRNTLSESAKDAEMIEVLQDQASYKVGSLLRADCWIEIPAGIRVVNEGDQARVHEL
jgi:molybdenum cofactor synthesis domain-containing protein